MLSTNCHKCYQYIFEKKKEAGNVFMISLLQDTRIYILCKKATNYSSAFTPSKNQLASFYPSFTVWFYAMSVSANQKFYLTTAHGFRVELFMGQRPRETFRFYPISTVYSF